MKSLFLSLLLVVLGVSPALARDPTPTDYLICQAKQLESVAAATNGIDEPARFIVEVVCREEALAVAKFLSTTSPDFKDLPPDEAMAGSMDLVLRQTKMRVFEYRRNR